MTCVRAFSWKAPGAQAFSAAADPSARSPRPRRKSVQLSASRPQSRHALAAPRESPVLLAWN